MPESGRQRERDWRGRNEGSFDVSPRHCPFATRESHCLSSLPSPPHHCDDPTLTLTTSTTSSLTSLPLLITCHLPLVTAFPFFPVASLRRCPSSSIRHVCYGCCE